MISAVEYTHHFADGDYINIRYMHRITEVSIEYTAIDGHIEVEDFSFTSGTDLQARAIDIARRMDRSASERSEVRSELREFLDLIDQVHAE